MTHEFFFFTIEEYYRWLAQINTDTVRFMPAGTFDHTPTVYSLDSLPVFLNMHPEPQIGDTYLISDCEFRKKEVPKRRGSGAYLVFDRTTNPNSWLITFGGPKNSCLFPGELTGAVISEFDRQLISVFREIACIRSQDGRYLLSDTTLALHEKGYRLLPGMNANVERRFDVEV